jgi:hypothetical protein
MMKSKSSHELTKVDVHPLNVRVPSDIFFEYKSLLAKQRKNIKEEIISHLLMYIKENSERPENE